MPVALRSPKPCSQSDRSDSPFPQSPTDEPFLGFPWLGRRWGGSARSDGNCAGRKGAFEPAPHTVQDERFASASGTSEEAALALLHAPEDAQLVLREPFCQIALFSLLPLLRAPLPPAHLRRGGLHARSLRCDASLRLSACLPPSGNPSDILLAAAPLVLAFGVRRDLKRYAPQQHNATGS